MTDTRSWVLDCLTCGHSWRVTTDADEDPDSTLIAPLCPECGGDLYDVYAA